MKKPLLSGAILLIYLLTTVNISGQYTGSYENVAVFKLATAEDSIAGFEPSKAVDMSLSTYCSLDENAPTWLQVDLGTFYIIDGFGLVVPLQGELPRSFTFQVSENGLDWYNRGSEEISDAGEYSYNINSVGDIRYVRFLITAKDALASINMVQVFGQEIVVPSSPPEALAATGISYSGFSANWSKRLLASGYTLSVATDVALSNPVPGYVDLDVGNVLQWPVTGLSPDTTYYYRVKAYNIVGSTDYSNIAAVTTLKYQEITFATLEQKTYGDESFDLFAIASSGLPVSYTSTNETVATVLGFTVTIVGAGTTTIIAHQEGDPDYDAAEPVEQEFLVNPAELIVSGITAENKEYDGTDKAVISGAILEGILGMDDVSMINDTSALFAQSDAGSDLGIITNINIEGEDAANYVLLQPTGLTATITLKSLTVQGAVAEDKVYDGTTEAVISGASLEGVISGDDIVLNDSDVGQFEQASVGPDIVVTASMTLGGEDMGNYSLTLPAGLTASISARELTVAAESMVRLTCEETGAFVITYDGFADSEDENVLDTQPTASCTATEDSPAGEYPITVSGGVAENYQFIYVDGTLTIAADDIPPVLTVKDITIQLDQSGQASITIADVLLSAEDNCGITDTTLSQDSFTTDDLGDVNVLVTALDAEGNSTVEIAVVAVDSYVGINSVRDWNSLVYPNPTEGRVEMILPVEVDHVKVMDMTGKTVLSRSNLTSTESFDLSPYGKGIYIFQLLIKDDTQHVKVIKR